MAALSAPVSARGAAASRIASTIKPNVAAIVRISLFDMVNALHLSIARECRVVLRTARSVCYRSMIKIGQRRMRREVGLPPIEGIRYLNRRFPKLGIEPLALSDLF